MAWNNYCMFTGRLAKDLEVALSSKGRIYGKATIVTNKRYKGVDGNYVDKATYVDIVLYNDKLVKSLEDKLKKGTLVTVQCEFETSSYIDKNGEKRRGYSFIVKEIRILSYPKNQQSSQQNVNFAPSNEFSTNHQKDSNEFSNMDNFDIENFSAVDDDSDIPF